MPRVKSLSSSIRKATSKRGPVWTGPNGAGPQGGVTQGLLAKFLKCRERFRLYTVEGIRLKPTFRPAIEFGNLWHTCEEYHATNKNNTLWQDALMLDAAALAQRYPFSRDDVRKWHGVVATQFPCYLDYWSKHEHSTDRTPVLAEEAFDVPYQVPGTLSTVRLRGKWDSVDRVGKEVWLMENKTKSRIDEEKLRRRLTFDIQTMLYLIALRDSGVVPKGTKVAGVRYNVIRRDCPISRHKARSNKAKKTFTPEETEEHFFARLRDDYFLADPQDWFLRFECRVSEADVAKFEEEFLAPCLADLLRWWEETCNGGRWYRTPYGVDIVDEYDDYAPYLESGGSMIGYERTDELFPELNGG